MVSDNDDDSSIFSTTLPDFTEPSALYEESVVNSVEPVESIITSTQTPNLENEYDGFPWDKFSAFAKADHSKGNFSSWVWKYGYRVQEIKSTQIYWFCKPCICCKEHKPVKYQHAGGTANAIRHLQKAHNIDKDGSIPKK